MAGGWRCRPNEVVCSPQVQILARLEVAHLANVGPALP
jgi:hypothetical protein